MNRESANVTCFRMNVSYERTSQKHNFEKKDIPSNKGTSKIFAALYGNPTSYTTL